MSQANSQQTKIDQFYKVVSNKNTGCGIKLSDQKYNTCHKPRKSSYKLNKSSVKKSTVVESEVQIIYKKVKDPLKSINHKKRTISSELENSPEKIKLDDSLSLYQSTINSQTPLKMKGQGDINTSEENINCQKCMYSPKSQNVLEKFKSDNSLSSSNANSQTPLKIRSPSEINSSTQTVKSQKRTFSLELKNSPKKLKSDDSMSSDHVNHQASLRSLSDINSLAPSSDLQNSLEKFTSDDLLSLNNINNQTPLKIRSPSQVNSPGKKSSFSPKKSPQKNSLSPKTNKLSPRKLFFADRINFETVQQAVENLNFVRQGNISLNVFDLETIYQNQEFSFIYSDVVSPNSQKFELKDIIFPQEKHADHLLMVVMDVFSNPMNCGYFLKNELDLIFHLFTLSPESQMLFVRLLKRKLSWYRTSSIKYLEIATDLNLFFKELVQNKFCVSDLESVDILVLLNLLQVDEVRSICQKLKIDHRGNKTVLTTKLLKYGNSTKSFFAGAKSPKSVLRSMALLILQTCVCLPKNIINLFDRILTLLHPIQDPAESIADLFLTLTNVHKGEILYPPVPKRETFPIFQSRSHLIDFVESKNALKEVLSSIENKNWESVKDLGRLALKHLSSGQDRQEKSTVPLHVRKFEPTFVWAKVLSKSVDAFKKRSETIPEAVHILQTLIADKSYSQSSRGRWYSELALIEMHHKKDLESSAALTLHALQQDTLTEVDVSDLLERLRKLMRRKNGISKETRQEIQKVQENIESKSLLTQLPITKTITANMANRISVGGKSTWSVNINGNDKYYGSVEMLALQYYTSKEDFNEGLHCEGSLPVTLFAVYFWDELYNFFVPGTFVTPYQDAPLDLFTSEFFSNRKQTIEEKLNFNRSLDLESFTEWMQARYSIYSQYRSVMSNTLFKDDQQFKEVVLCLGINGVTGICERLISNFRLWRAGFPDLIVWNALIPKCKIVEVKGPGDSLSEKQKLWLQYLENLGIETEVCRVEALGISSK